MSNVFIDALASQSWTEIGRDADIGFAFSDEYIVWSAAERQQVYAALASIEAVCNITFTPTVAASADIVEHRVTHEQLVAAIGDDYFAGVQGWHYAPADVSGAEPARGYYDTAGLSANHAGWMVLHELLHAVGLEHPHSTWHGSGLFPGVAGPQDAGTYGLNSTLTTVMSYRAHAGFAARADGPMAFDIAALQHLYGARVPYAEGPNTYTLARGGLLCIWDTGGTDWIVAPGAGAAVIDLRAATLDVSPLGGGVLSHAAGYAGGLTVAHGVVIENARGGAGANTITGNDAANTLIGGGGNDTIRGGAGNDRLNGQGGADVLYGQDGADVFVFAAITDSRSQARDRIAGFDSADRIDLSALDANAGAPGNQSFTWRGTAAFSGAAGDLHALRTAHNTYLVEADTDGDRAADLSIIVTSLTALACGDFIL